MKFKAVFNFKQRHFPLPQNYIPKFGWKIHFKPLIKALSKFINILSTRGGKALSLEFFEQQYAGYKNKAIIRNQEQIRNKTKS